MFFVELNGDEYVMKSCITYRCKFLTAFMSVFVCVFILLPTLAKAQSDVTHVILVRHGQTDYNLEGRWQGFLDIPLNDTGIRQAELLAESLKDVPIDVFISSPLKRAYVTTEKCAQLHGKDIAYTDDRLKEINFGVWAGMKKTDVAKKYAELNKLWEERPWLVKIPQGESIRELGNRYLEALEDAARKYPGKTIFTGAHSLGNMALICKALDISLVHFGQLGQDNTCVNVLEYKDGQWRLLLMNSISHTGKLYK